jgi:uncharacterized protein
MATEARRLVAEAVLSGSGSGAMLMLDAPLSFWGGFDSETGTVIEAGHPQHGASLAGVVLLMERAKGSSSSSSVLAEAIRNGTGPVAIVMRERDLIVGLGCIVASELYGIDVPIVVVDAAGWATLEAAARGGALRVKVHAGEGGAFVEIA